MANRQTRIKGTSPKNDGGGPTDVLQSSWSRALAPLLEALVRAGAEAEAGSIIAELGPEWTLLDVKTKLKGLAVSLGRPDLVARWQRMCQLTKVQLPEMPSADQFPLIVLNQSCRLELERYYSRGLRMSVIPASKDWCQWLGWPEHQQHWALLDQAGKVLMGGEQLPSQEVFDSLLASKDVLTRLGMLEGLVSKHPDNLEVRFYYLEELLRVGLEETPPHLRNMTPKKTLPPVDELGDLGMKYLQSLEKVLEHDYAFAVGMSGDYRQIWPILWGKDPLLKQQAHRAYFEKLAHRFLPRIETELQRRPTSEHLWYAWMTFASVVDRPLGPVFDTTIPPPLLPATAWPPRVMREDYVRMLRLEGRWQAVVDFLKPGWKAFAESVDVQKSTLGDKQVAKAYDFSAWDRLLVPLAEAYLGLGLESEADRLVKVWADWEFQPGDMKSLCRTAEGKGFANIVKEWRMRFR